ncbi:hypothetical protein B6N25_08825 [Sphingobacteriales bacterium TSM_CSS]|nr:hypothetical protein B6N25_08825 [Sphingobacteriales bacterium TSM_CSS]
MKTRQKISRFAIFLAVFAFALVNSFYSAAQTSKPHIADTSKSASTKRKFTEEDLRKISVYRYKLKLNGKNIPDKQVSDIMDLLDPKLGTEYYKGRELGKIGTGLLITSSVFLIVSSISYVNDIVTNIDQGRGAESLVVSPATKITGSLCLALLTTGTALGIAGSTKKSKVFKEFSERWAAKYSHTHSAPSINLTPYYTFGGSMPTSGGLQLTISF